MFSRITGVKMRFFNLKGCEGASVEALGGILLSSNAKTYFPTAEKSKSIAMDWFELGAEAPNSLTQHLLRQQNRLR